MVPLHQEDKKDILFHLEGEARKRSAWLIRNNSIVIIPIHVSVYLYILQYILSSMNFKTYYMHI